MHPIVWLGGSPCAGKSTIAARIGARYGHHIYSCDDAYFRHQQIISAELQPIFSQISKLTGDDLWMRPVSQQIEEELTVYREEFPFILSDLLAHATIGPVIAEGAALLPEMLACLGVASARSIWMVPMETFQRKHYAQRAWRHDVLSACSNPEKAWQNWMDRDAGFARAVTTQAEQLGYYVLATDGIGSLDETFELVEAHLSL